MEDYYIGKGGIVKPRMGRINILLLALLAGSVGVILFFVVFKIVP